ncbi:AAA family ATPase [Methylocystis bryophila]|uniref:AAA+ ATPase domain-containing protein n=1 Tax=Methylocystis bryophila TaxID=655015 RepID=A0A1W6MT34_9HYPH|nr:AAA family ATPase [Methylocystis bryophila]ARN80686.1 hypothetical protein B1812_05915 [Methylocystis bryophila]BDV40752.1 hypothetical protein DSM21852_40050 [Methylocystis bryophila]
MSSQRPRIVSIEEIDAAEPYDRYNPPGAPAGPPRVKFHLEHWRDIAFTGFAEWLIKHVLPLQGLAAIYSKPGSFKSFIAFHIALCVALGRAWGGRRVAQAAVVYIGAEGAAGLRKRKAGYQIAEPDLPGDLPFALISAAPNLGSDNGDLSALIAAIESANLEPGLIVIDTLSRTMGAGDENGAGMTAFIANAGALAEHFKALVLIVHHSGLGDDKRLRGHSSLNGALDAQILCERAEGDLAATLTLQKLKDDASDVRLRARLSRVVIGHDEDGDEISTLVVDEIEDAEAAKIEKPRIIPRAQRLLMSVIDDAIDDAGEDLRPYGPGGPTVRAITDEKVRQRFFARIAEQAEPDEDKEKLFDRQRKGFKRSIEAALKAESLVAVEKNGRRFLWLP